MKNISVSQTCLRTNKNSKNTSNLHFDPEVLCFENKESARGQMFILNTIQEP